MSCNNEETLLLLAHDQLGLRDKLATLWHLHRCAACRERYQSLYNVSLTLMNAAALPDGSPRVNRLHILPSGMALAMRLLLATALVLATLFVATALYRQHTAAVVADHCLATPPAAPAAKKPRPCAPDLPNDHCQ